MEVGPIATYHCVFTLIELLVVISIIALLIMMLLPAIEGVRDAAQVTGFANNHHQLLITLHTWSADNDGNFPPHSSYNAWSVVTLPPKTSPCRM